MTGTVDGSSNSAHRDEAPIFPAIDSSQRLRTAPSISLQLPDDDDDEEDDEDEEPRPSSAATALRPIQTAPSRRRQKVRIEPGFSQLDWARLRASGANLRGPGVDSIRRVTPAELAQHRTKDDAWAAFGGRVYNISPYLKFHPGGVAQLMRVAGKDGTELFMKTHSWISVEALLDCCLVGILVR